MAIEWLEEKGYKGTSWNPVTGCEPISEGCSHCYAKSLAETRLRGKYGYPKDNPFKVTMHNDRLDMYSDKKTPHKIFICSMSDLWHDDVPDSFIMQVLSRAILNDQHKYIVLTKRPQRMMEYIHNYKVWDWPGFPHIWLGVTAENQQRADERIPILQQCETKNIFISAEPLLGPIDLTKYLDNANNDINPLRWIIVGGESGEGCRPMDLNWVRSLIKQCHDSSTAIWVKQLGGVRNHRERTQALIDGKLYKEMPE